MNAANIEMDRDVSDQIVAFKRELAPRRAELKRAFAEVRDHIARAADAIQADRAAGRLGDPRDRLSPTSPPARSATTTRAAIRRTGCAIVRGVYPRSPGERLVRRARPTISTPTATRRRRSRSAASTSISRR